MRSGEFSGLDEVIQTARGVCGLIAYSRCRINSVVILAERGNPGVFPIAYCLNATLYVRLPRGFPPEARITGKRRRNV